MVDMKDLSTSHKFVLLCSKHFIWICVLYYFVILCVLQLRSEGRVANVGDVVKRGDHVKVKVLSIQGTKLSLSMKVSVLINTKHLYYMQSLK